MVLCSLKVLMFQCLAQVLSVALVYRCSKGYCRLTNKLTEWYRPFDVNSNNSLMALKGKYVLPFIITGDIFEPSVSVKFAKSPL